MAFEAVSYVMYFKVVPEPREWVIPIAHVNTIIRRTACFPDGNLQVNKIAAIKYLRATYRGMGLQDAKEIIETAIAQDWAGA